MLHQVRHIYRIKRNDSRRTFSFRLEPPYRWHKLLSHRESPNPDRSGAKPTTQSPYQLSRLPPSVRFNVTHRGRGGDLKYVGKYSFTWATMFSLMTVDYNLFILPQI